jgi:hypothetical protein
MPMAYKGQTPNLEVFHMALALGTSKTEQVRWRVSGVCEYQSLIGGYLVLGLGQKSNDSAGQMITPATG